MRWATGRGLRTSYASERTAAVSAVERGDIEEAWGHLERAHVLAQPFPVAHVGSHLAMLRLGWTTHDRAEVTGQLVRVLVAGPASLVGKIPGGNTGRAAVPLRAELPVPPDLAELLGRSS